MTGAAQGWREAPCSLNCSRWTESALGYLRESMYQESTLK